MTAGLLTMAQAGHTDGPNGRPVHPKYGDALSGAPRTIDGVTFRPYRRGIMNYVRVSDDFRVEVWMPSHRNTYRVSVDGVTLPTKFRSEDRAYRAALAKAEGQP